MLFSKPCPTIHFGSVLLPYVLLLHAAAAFSQPPGTAVSLKTLTTRRDDTVKVNLLNQLGEYFLFTNGDSALYFATQAVALASRLDFDRGKVQGYNTQGVVYGMRGIYTQALPAFLNVLRLNETQGDEKGTAATLSNLAKIYLEQKKYREALAALQRARQLDQALQNWEGVSSDLLNLGAVYSAMGQRQEALRQYEETLRLNYRLKDERGLAISQQNIASIYVKQARYQPALDTITHALRLFTRQRDDYGRAIALQTKGSALQGLKRFNEAVATLTEGLEISLREEFLENQRGIYQALTKTYQAQGRYREALLAQQRYQTVQDSLFNQEQARQLLEIEAKYEVEKKQQRIAFLEEEARSGQVIKGLAVVVTVLALAVVLVFYRAYRLQKKIALQKEALLDQEKKQYETQQQLEAQEKARLQAEVAFKQRELLTKALHLEQKNQLFESLQAQLEQLAGAPDSPNRPFIREMTRAIRHNMRFDEEWEHIKSHFENVHPGFFSKLRQLCPALTENELKHCAYLKMRLSLKEIAHILGVDTNAVKVSRYRLKKKLELGNEVDLKDFIAEL